MDGAGKTCELLPRSLRAAASAAATTLSQHQPLGTQGRNTLYLVE